MGEMNEKNKVSMPAVSGRHIVSMPEDDRICGGRYAVPGIQSHRDDC